MEKRSRHASTRSGGNVVVKMMKTPEAERRVIEEAIEDLERAREAMAAMSDDDGMLVMGRAGLLKHFQTALIAAGTAKARLRSLYCLDH